MLQRLKAIRNHLSLYVQPSKTTALNFLWYLFIIIAMGQFGPLMVGVSEVWKSGKLHDSFYESAANGEIILCSTAILAGGIYFLIKEYNSASQQISWKGLKSLLLLWSTVLGLSSLFVSYQLVSQHSFTSELQKTLHWWIYSLSLITATVLWLMEELQANAKNEVALFKEQAGAMTTAASANTSINGAKI